MPVPLTVSNFTQNRVSVALANGQFAAMIRVSYDVMQGQIIVARHVQDYVPAQATSATITNDVQSFVKALRATLDATSSIQG